jgi:MYXO-CTERM domain-containing protein
MRTSVRSLAAAVSTLAIVSSAQADLPPPDGEKFVDYAFSVRGLSASSDRVLLAFPCSGSNGAPSLGHQKLEEGKSVRVGRRGGTCALRHAAKADYEAFASKYKPTGSFQDPPLEEFMKAALPCEGGPSIRTQIPKTDPRSVVEEKLVVRALSATVCKVAVDTGAPDAKKPSEPGPAPATPTPPPAPESPPAPPPVKRGCSTSPSSSPSGALFGVAVVALGLAARSRRRRT